MPIFRPITSEPEHHRVLCELGVLDDLEDWPLYQQQEARYHLLEDTIDLATWRRYLRQSAPRPRPNPHFEALRCLRTTGASPRPES